MLSMKKKQGHEKLAIQSGYQIILQLLLHEQSQPFSVKYVLYAQYTFFVCLMIYFIFKSQRSLNILRKYNQ